jgi:zinc transport system ATP-binding protein
MIEENILGVKNLTVEVEDNTILSNLNFEVKKGETLAVIGPNGAGKSVLFRTLLGLIPHKGEVVWQKGIKIGYVPQKFYIEKNFPLSVSEFLEFKKGSKSIKEALSLTGLAEKKILHKKLGNLSGGELQRVLIAWSILDNPDVVLFDEPLTGIDIGGEETIYSLIHSLSQAKQSTMLLISHDLGMVYKYANNVLCINKKQICLGTPDDVVTDETTKKLYGQHHQGIHHHHEALSKK